MERNTGSRARAAIGRIIGSILPRDDAFREEYDHSHLQEYHGPRYDDPHQLAEVRRRLGMSVLKQEVDQSPAPTE